MEKQPTHSAGGSEGGSDSLREREREGEGKETEGEREKGKVEQSQVLPCTTMLVNRNKNRYSNLKL